MTKRIHGPEPVSLAPALWVGLLRVGYEIAFLVFAFFYLPFFFVKRKYQEGLRARFGGVSDDLRRTLTGHKVIWVHGVSVGEAIQAVRLVEALRENLLDAKFIFTTTTFAGQQAVQKLKSDEDAASYLPVDFRACVRSFIRYVRPAAAVILETEIWPNLIFELNRWGAPTFIVNGRISTRAFRQYRFFRFFLRQVFHPLAGIFVQDELMRSRFLSLGAPQERVAVTGNMKFDWQPHTHHEETLDSLHKKLLEEKAFVCVAGSTHAGEEEMLFDVFRSVQSQMPSFRLFIAPRHLERISAIEKQALKKEVRLKKFSELALSQSASAKQDLLKTEVFIVDRMGVLPDFYRIADLVFVGGSLVRVGGHNLVEAAFFEKPILFGPFMDNFKEMVEGFKEAQAAVEVRDARRLETEILVLARDAERRRRLGAAAKQLVLKHQGATQKNVELLLKTFS